MDSKEFSANEYQVCSCASCSEKIALSFVTGHDNLRAPASVHGIFQRAIMPNDDASHSLLFLRAKK
jgi:hypothetical protein